MNKYLMSVSYNDTTVDIQQLIKKYNIAEHRMVDP